ncbi:MAG: OmpH family outer membrane protein [Lachnospiraceae bacterium]|nr:OmpH family outer membrane protein [Lachnospiraceae bacterium]MDD4247908.1 OmpH family outer membrane protein [Methanosarcina sp.]
MERLIYTYSLIKAFYDEKKDYADCFVPLILSSCPKGKYLSRSKIKERIKLDYDLDIQEYVIDSFIMRSMKSNYIAKIKRDQKFPLYTITEEGIKYREKFEKKNEISRRVESLVRDMQLFFISKNVSTTTERIKEKLELFIKENFLILMEFINPDSPNNITAPKHDKKCDELIADYILLAQNEKPSKYKTIHDMILGSVISLTFYSVDETKFAPIDKMNFESCELFLDSNFVFSILGLEDEKLCRPNKEVFELLKNYKFQLKIFSTTVDEICRVINQYLDYDPQYSPDVHTHAIHSYMRRTNWTRTQVQEYIQNIDDILAKQGITKITLDGINLETYTAIKIPIEKTLDYYKPNKSVCVYNHDLIAIDKIIEFRGGTQRKLEKCKALFLTSDSKLSKYDFIEIGHKKNGTISEVMLCSILANILWIKDPNTKLPIESIMAFHAQDLFIKSAIWQRFQEICIQMLKEKTLTSENISNLFYRNYIEDVLKEFDDHETDEIDAKFLMKQVQISTKVREDDLKKMEKDKNNELKEKIEKIVRIKDEEKEKDVLKVKTQMEESLKKKDEEMQKQIDNVKEQMNKFLEEKEKETKRIAEINKNMNEYIENAARKKAENYSYVIISVGSVIYLYIVYILYKKFELFDPNFANILFGGIYSGSGITFILLFNKIKQFIFDHIYSKNIFKPDIDSPTNKER